jgi:hypothetical protein
MTTTTAIPETRREPGSGNGGRSGAGSVLRSTRAELLRLRKWPAVWVTVGAWLAMNAMFGYIFDYITYSTGDNSFSNEGQSPAELLATLLPGALADKLPQGMPMFGGAIMMVLGAIIAGNGYGWAPGRRCRPKVRPAPAHWPGRWRL